MPRLPGTWASIPDVQETRPDRPEVRHRGASGSGGLKSLIASLATLIGWFALSIASVLVILIALWITSALAHAQTGRGAPGGFASWALAAGLCLGAPLVLVLWKHGADRRRIATALGWFPLVWNLGGLAVAGALVPDLVGTALRQHGAWFIIDRVGDSHTWTRYLSALGHNTADLVDPPADRPEPLAVIDPGESAPADAITVPFSADGNAILMDVELEGPGGRATFPYLFDTGASFTTISSASAERLGIDVPEDAPTLHFNTASGPRESRMVYLPALRLGDVTLHGLLVSVCDGCTNDRSEGLLGLNVIREFLVQMDYQAARMRLIPRHRERPNRSYDINPAVRLEIEGRPEIWLGRVRWIVEIENRSSVAIEDVVPEINFSDGLRLRGETVERIEPGAIGRSLVEGKTKAREGGELGFTLSLAEAYW